MGHFPRAVKSSTPPEIAALVAAGIWPADAPAMRRQVDVPPVPSDVVVRETDGDERALILQAPPFPTLADEVRLGATKFWARYGALDQVDPAGLLILGDFGHGSDAPFVLERGIPHRVLRLRWGETGNVWVVWADSLPSLLRRLGLLVPPH